MKELPSRLSNRLFCPNTGQRKHLKSVRQIYRIAYLNTLESLAALLLLTRESILNNDGSFLIQLHIQTKHLLCRLAATGQFNSITLSIAHAAERFFSLNIKEYKPIREKKSSDLLDIVILQEFAPHLLSPQLFENYTRVTIETEIQRNKHALTLGAYLNLVKLTDIADCHRFLFAMDQQDKSKVYTALLHTYLAEGVATEQTSDVIENLRRKLKEGGKYNFS